MSNSQGGFAATVKDQPVIEDTLSGGQLKPIRHANGRDWWLIVPRYKVNQYYIYLLDPTGIHLVNIQAIGPETNSQTVVSQAAVSPDGSKYCRFSAPGGLLVFDFDRCAGKLSNLNYGGSALDIYNCNGNGLAISPNSRYLYLALCDSLFQFDLAAQDLFASRQVVQTYFGPDPLEGLMAFAQLAPDGKIYLVTGNGTLNAHIIHQPDEPGLACNAENGAIIFDTPKVSYPNLPNFRLGPIDGSVCDSLGIDNMPWAHWRWQSDTVSALTAWFRDLSAYEPDTWQWNFDDPASGSANASTARNPVHQFSGPGTYHVCLTISNAHGTDTFCRDLLLSGVATAAPFSSDELITRPNPVQSDWEILLKTPLAVSATMTLYDISGRQTAQYTLPRGTATQRIVLGDLPPGLYAWVLEGAGVRLAQGKVVKVE